MCWKLEGRSIFWFSMLSFFFVNFTSSKVLQTCTSQYCDSSAVKILMRLSRTHNKLPPLYLHALSRARAALYIQRRRNIHFYLFLFPAALAQNTARRGALSSSSLSMVLAASRHCSREIRERARSLFVLLHTPGVLSVRSQDTYRQQHLSPPLLLLSLQHQP